MKSDPKSDAKAGDKAVGEQGPELTKVEVGPVSSSITEQLTIAEMENVTTVFRSGVNVTVTINNQKPMTDSPPRTSENLLLVCEVDKLITSPIGILRRG